MKATGADDEWFWQSLIGARRLGMTAVPIVIEEVGLRWLVPKQTGHVISLEFVAETSNQRFDVNFCRVEMTAVDHDAPLPCSEF